MDDHIGIRMVMSMVKKVRYVNTLGLNNLTLTFNGQNYASTLNR